LLIGHHLNINLISLRALLSDANVMVRLGSLRSMAVHLGAAINLQKEAQSGQGAQKSDNKKSTKEH
jgi:hypothetical protein